MPATLREPLTLRQLQLLVYAANGLTAAEIAREEGISPNTVKNTFAQARVRAGARNLTHLVAICVNAGLIVHVDEAR